MKRRNRITALVAASAFAASPALAQSFTETKDTRVSGSGGNESKATAEVINLGTSTSATISGFTTGALLTGAGADNTRDYYRINTSYTTPGIYMNTLDLTASPDGNGGTRFLGRLRGLSQTSGTITPGSDALFQTTTSSGTSTPFGLNRWYSFGGASQTQSVYWAVDGLSGGGNYTARFTASLVTLTDLGKVSNAGPITIAAAANLSSATPPTSTNLAAVVLDSNFNVYFDPVTGLPASNDNPAANVAGFSLARNYAPGVYYLAIGQTSLATNQASASDDTVRSTPVLDFDNVMATGNTFYNGAGGITRPADFTIRNSVGATTVSTSGQAINQIFGVNFYRFEVVVQPEPGAGALVGVAALPAIAAGGVYRRRRRRAGATSRPAGAAGRSPAPR